MMSIRKLPVLPLGSEGLWYGMNGIGNYSFYLPDTETQPVFFICAVRENSGWSTWEQGMSSELQDVR